MTVARDYYEVLELARDAPPDAIKKAYRRLARLHHPDVNPGDADAESRFKELNRAHEVLSDPDRRARYDRFGDSEGQPGGGGGAGFDPFGSGGLGDLFDAFFGGAGGGRGGGPAGPPRGVDLEVTVDLDFAEAVFGAKKDVEVRTAVPCSVCHATGSEPGTAPEKCKDCGGAGQVRRVRQSILGQMVSTSPCPSCAGMGEIIAHPCSNCRAEGRIVDTRTYTVDIPAGVDDGTTLRLSGRGAVGQRGGPAGDLYVHSRVKADRRFERDGADLHHKFKLSFAQAALGTRLPLETMDGTEEVVVQRGTQSGVVVRFRGKGVPHLQGRGRGDLLVELVVETPVELAPEEEQLLRQIATLRGDMVAEPDQGFLARIKSAFR